MVHMLCVDSAVQASQPIYNAMRFRIKDVSIENLYQKFKVCAKKFDQQRDKNLGSFDALFTALSNKSSDIVELVLELYGCLIMSSSDGTDVVKVANNPAQMDFKEALASLQHKVLFADEAIAKTTDTRESEC